MNKIYKDLLQTKTLTDFFNVRFGMNFESEMEKSDTFFTNYEYKIDKFIYGDSTFGFDYLIINHQFDFDFQSYKIVSYNDLKVFNHAVSLGLFIVVKPSDIFCFIKFNPNDDYTIFQDYRIIKSFIKHRMWFGLQCEKDLHSLMFAPDFVIESFFNYIVSNSFHFTKNNDLIIFLYEFRHRFTHSFKHFLEFILLRNRDLDEKSAYTMSLILNKNFLTTIKYDQFGGHLIFKNSFQHAKQLFNEDELERYYFFHKPSEFESQEMFDYLITIHAVSYRIVTSMSGESEHNIDWKHIVISEQQAINMFLRHFSTHTLDYSEINEKDFVDFVLKFEKEKWHDFRSIVTEEIFEI